MTNLSDTALSVTALSDTALGGLLAQRHNWERLGDRLSGDNANLQLSELGWIVAFIVAVLLLVWWLQRLTQVFEGRTARPQPGRLFRELCRAHSLNRSERLLLNNLATATGQEQAVHLFMRCDLFDESKLPGEATALAELREKLFAA